MSTTSNFLSNKRIGTLMLVNTILMVVAMLLHPEGTSQNIDGNSAMKWVHGILIFLLVFNAYGLNRLISSIKANGRDTNLGMLFYYIGLGSIIGAALVSGFVQTALPEYFSITTETFKNFNRFSAIFNQALAILGISSFGAAGLFLAPALVSDTGISRYVGVVGGIVGFALILSMLTGIYLSVLSMTILAILIALWHVMIATWLVKN